MIKQIEIHKEGYKDFELVDLTANTIIFFSTPALKNKVLKEIEPIWLYGENEDNSVIYIMETQDEENPYINLEKCNVRYLPTTIVNLRGEKGQRFVFTIEAPFIFTAKDWYDIWFVDENNDGEIECWAFSEFKGAKDTWVKGLDVVYEEFCSGRYGCYRGYIK